MISSDSIDRIMEAIRIEEVVGEFVQLKRAGSNYKGLSPWSQERTPSFFVSPAKGIFKDFSSGKGGNAVSFLMELENMTYPEALRFLAAKYRIELEETQMDPEKQEELSIRESLAVVNAFAFEHFERNLWDTETGQSIGLSYFRERGYTDQTIKTFGLGYSPEKSDDFLKTALDAGHKKENLLTLGLAKSGEHGDYDFFRGRVMFPIRNVSGRCIAFAGRTLRSDNKVKYLNSPESELYDKSNTLYGIFEGKRNIIQQDMCFLTEGYTDVISLHQAGVENAVASSGTSLTPGQIKLIKRYTSNVTLLYDGDQAGIKAALRGIDLLLESDMRVKVLLFPDGHDPDSYSKAVSQTEFEAYLKAESKDFSDFVLKVLLSESGDDPIKKTDASRRLLESISKVNDHIARSVYIERASKQLGIPEQALYNELNKILRRNQQQRKSSEFEPSPAPDVNAPLPQQKTQEEADIQLYEKEIARILVNYGDKEFELDLINEDQQMETMKVSVAEFILHDLETDQIIFESEVCSAILMTYKLSVDTETALPDPMVFINNPNPALSQTIAEMIASPHELSGNWVLQHKIYTDLETDNLKRTVFDPLMRLKLSQVRRQSRLIDAQLKVATSNDEIDLILADKMRWDEKKKELTSYFGTTIL